MVSRVVIIVFLICLLSTTVFASGKYFVDFDGDGFDDNIIDVDNNSIPDEFQSQIKQTKSSSRTFTFSPLTLSSDTPKTNSLEVSQQFALNQFKARLLTNCRSNFELDFNSSLNVSSSSSSNCVGGVCF